MMIPLIATEPVAVPRVESYYRIYDQSWAAPLDEYDNPIPGGGRITLEVMTIPILKHTPKGVWIGYTEDGKRFVRNEGKKKFACATMKEALESFIARKKRQYIIYSSRANVAQYAKQLAEAKLQNL